MKFTAALMLALCSVAQAEQTFLKQSGRMLEDKKSATAVFGPSYSMRTTDFNPSQILGIVIGFLLFGAFLIWVVVAQTMDAIQRDKGYQAEVDRLKDILRTEHNYTED